jgi:hypothetical protein
MFSKSESEPFLADNDELPTRSFQNSNSHDLSTRFKCKPLTPPRGLSHLVVFLATSLFWGILIYITHFQQTSQIPANTYRELKLTNPEVYGNFAANARFLTCGFSIEEAKALGCQYDILVGKWLPRFCIDEKSILDYQSDGSWFGYADEDRTELLSIEQMSEMDFYHTSVRDHIVHCAVLWRKQYQAFFEGRSIMDSMITSREHTHHCSQFLIEMTDAVPEYRTTPIKVFVEAGGCFVKD